MGEKKIINKNSTRAISTLIIVVIVVIAVVVVGVGVYVGTHGSSKSSSSATPTPKPTATATSSSSATATPKPTSTSTSGITTATSYEFNETGRASNGTVLDTVYYAAKNIGTSNAELLWVVTAPSSSTTELIVNGAQQKVWENSGGTWTDLSAEYSSFQSTVQSSAGVYVNMLTYYGGGSGSYTYTIPSGQPNAGYTSTFTNIQINPSLSDSMFQAPS